MISRGTKVWIIDSSLLNKSHVGFLNPKGILFSEKYDRFSGSVAFSPKSRGKNGNQGFVVTTLNGFARKIKLGYLFQEL